MTDEDLIARLNNLFWMLEEGGHYTKANTARFASDRIEAQAAEIERLWGELAKAVEALRGWIEFANEEGIPVSLSDLEAAALTGARP